MDLYEKSHLLLNAITSNCFDSTVLQNYLTDILTSNNLEQSWQDLSITLVSIPDQVANKNFGQNVLRPVKYYTELLKCILEVVARLATSNHKFSRTSYYLICNIVGKVALIGHTHLVFNNFISLVLKERSPKAKRILLHCLRIPFNPANDSFTSLETFMEVLYSPIFKYSDIAITHLDITDLFDYSTAYSNKTFKYLLLNSMIDGYNCPKEQQYKQLTNMLVYLSQLSAKKSFDHEEPLIEFLRKVASSWSNKLQILFRPQEQNVYITRALILSFRFCLELPNDSLIACIEDMHSTITTGVPVYLNRASSNQRNLAICVAETIFTKLNDLINVTKDRPTGESNQINFDLELDCDSVELVELFKKDIKILCTS